MHQADPELQRHRLIVADPSLRDKAGHHYMTSVRLIEAADRLGFFGILASHKAFDELGTKVQVYGIYSDTIYFERLADTSLPSAEPADTTTIGAETAVFFDLISASRDDVILFHTMTINATVSVLNALAPPDARPSYHFLFRYDPLVADWGGDPVDLRRLLERLRGRGQIQRIFLYAETDALAELYQDLLDFPVTVMLHFTTYDSAPPIGTRRDPLQQQVAYFGEARVEKGFDALPEAIACAYDRNPGGFTFVCQTYASRRNQAEIASSVGRLHADSASRGYQLFDNLDAEAYSALLFSSDVIVMPYRLPQYERRGSGVFIDALLSGANIVVRTGSWMAKYSKQAPLFEFETDAGLAEAICAALGHPRGSLQKTPVDASKFTPISNIEIVLRNHHDTAIPLLRKSVLLTRKSTVTSVDPPTRAPFFSIITAVRNDVWSLLKTARSVFEQDFKDFEYIVVDGASDDHASSLIDFWQCQGLVTHSIQEPDTGVYNAMNKGLFAAKGQFLLFLNASDVFSTSSVLRRVHEALTSRPLEGLLGWGELNNQTWASWTENEAFKMASLGFCHQSLYVRRDILLEEPFDERSFKTDSDTRQLGRLYAKGACIAILPEVLAVRGGAPGISADLVRSGRSIRSTLAEEYTSLSEATIEQLLAFRRSCQDPELMLSLLDLPDRRLVSHLARVVLDTLFQPQSTKLEPPMYERLIDRSLAILSAEENGLQDVDRLIVAQRMRAQFRHKHAATKRALDQAVSKFAADEERRIAKQRAQSAPQPGSPMPGAVISLTSFPARLQTVSFAIQSLFEQTTPPSEIHLWLGNDEVPGKNWLPKRLLALEERGLSIHFSKRTYHHYDKFIHNAELNERAPFVIVDDDVIYPPMAVEHLLRSHQRHPESIIGNRCHKMEIDRDGLFSPYSAWKREARTPKPSLLLLPTGAGGVLYPPGFFSRPMVTNVEEILAVAPYADDLWLKFCALAHSVPTFATELSHKADWYHRYTPTTLEGTLMATNVDLGLNDVQVLRCADWLTRFKPDWRSRLMADRAVA
jgi:hypothetical protein